MMQYLACDKFVKFEELYEFENRLWVFREYMEDEGDFKSIIECKNGNFTERFFKFTLYHVALRLQQMHSRNILHGSVKPDDMLCSYESEIKIVDFSKSSLLPERMPNLTEMDVWAFGCFAI